MLYKMFYSVLMGMSPWMASFSLPSPLAQAPQVQILDVKTETKEEYVQKEAVAKQTVQKWSKNDEDVARQFDLFCLSLQDGIAKGLLSAADAEKVLEAAEFAAQKHTAEFRSNPKKTPYIIHPIEVADSVMKIGRVYDKDVIIAALFHDLMDATGTSYEEITKSYGPVVAQYVKEMTPQKNLSLKEQKKAQIMQAFRQTPNVAIIKLSDKLSNLGTLANTPPSSWSRDRIDQYFQWAQSVVENLPESNLLLKKAVREVIADYWAKQNENKKSS
jgi:guanosine-3',5'-bis(diphosphate) 3'-pyrophosphohydrolase